MNFRLDLKDMFERIEQEKFFHKFNKEKNSAYLRSSNIAQREVRADQANLGRKTFKVVSRTYAGMFRAKVYNNDKNKLPSTLFFTNSPYFNIFQTGGTIRGKNGNKLLIPFPVKGKNIYTGRNGKKKWKNLLDKLRNNNQTFFRNVKGNVILFAKTDTNNRKELAGYKVDYRKFHNKKSVKSGALVPIAILKQSVNIKKRYDYNNFTRDRFSKKVIHHFNFNMDNKIK